MHPQAPVLNHFAFFSTFLHALVISLKAAFGFGFGLGSPSLVLGFLFSLFLAFALALALALALSLGGTVALALPFGLFSGFFFFCGTVSLGSVGSCGVSTSFSSVTCVSLVLFGAIAKELLRAAAYLQNFLFV